MIHHELLRRQAEGNPIRVGASAIEWMGSGFVAAMTHVPGMVLSALANADVNEAIIAFTSAGIPRDVIVEGKFTRGGMRCACNRKAGRYG